ncbi:MAG: hypothetical protein LBJ71_05440 [Holosporaceae bacterium]|nr:hypothetical protein [Holosporaceae bacterium]
MPQLDSSTFASQFFWVAIGFSLIYFFVSRVFVRRIDRVLSDRDFHVESIKKTAHQLKGEADRIEKSAAIELENAQMIISKDELEIVSNFREQSLGEKEKLCILLSENSKKESEALEQSSEKVFTTVINNNMDELIDAAMLSVSCSMKKESSNG